MKGVTLSPLVTGKITLCICNFLLDPPIASHCIFVFVMAMTQPFKAIGNNTSKIKGVDDETKGNDT